MYYLQKSNDHDFETFDYLVYARAEKKSQIKRNFKTKIQPHLASVMSKSAHFVLLAL